MGIRGILLDKDGTLYDYALTWLPANAAVAAMASRGDEALGRELLRLAGQEGQRVRPGSPLIAGTAAEIAQLWLPLLQGWEESELAEAIDQTFAEHTMRRGVPAVPLEPLLSGLRARGYLLGLATNDSEWATHVTLQSSEIAHHFCFVAGFDSGFGAKPGPGMGLAFCAATGLDPAEVAMVGDSPQDMKMALAAGLGARVAVLTGTAGPELLAPLADAVLRDIGELPGWLEARG